MSIPHLENSVSPPPRQDTFRKPGTHVRRKLVVDRSFQNRQEHVHAAEPVIDVLHEFGQGPGEAAPQLR